jgi:intergrase/recombinase
MFDLLEDLKPMTYNALRLSIKRTLGTRHRLRTLRKIWATFMRQRGIEPEVIDLLQGRTSRSHSSGSTTDPKSTRSWVRSGGLSV